ncbi:hypothetical protein NQ315_007543 [Exocentrus adspersus]|uniref:Uncharacterized protein n=1 Tax=Exocentrus adspersus TaxID=1586481 RepID=A0AAV8W7W6_9CUCU|nr:hypothetical protein NQ315_007543 [Exocentrus adspersus]
MNSLVVILLVGVVACAQASVLGWGGATLVGPANPGALLAGPSAKAVLAGPDGSAISAAAQGGVVAASPIAGGVVSAAVAPGAVIGGGWLGAPGLWGR